MKRANRLSLAACVAADGTIDYHARVQQQMDSPERTSEFLRLFMADDAANFVCSTGF